MLSKQLLVHGSNPPSSASPSIFNEDLESWLAQKNKKAHGTNGMKKTNAIHFKPVILNVVQVDHLEIPVVHREFHKYFMKRS